MKEREEEKRSEGGKGSSTGCFRQRGK